MKNAPRSKLLICFRPIVLDMDETDPKGSSNLQAYVSIQGRGSNITCSSSTPSSKVEEADTTTRTSIIRNHPLNISPSPKKNLSRVIKAVFFETILTRRIRDGKSLDRESKRSHGSCSSSRRRGKPQRGQLDEPNVIDKAEELASLVPTCSCSCSPESLGHGRSSCILSPPSRSVSAPELRILAAQVSTTRGGSENDPNKSGNSSPNDNYKNKSGNESSLYMLLVVSLTVIVVWGKLCAILFMSVWLYFLPRRQPTNTRFSSRQKEHGARRSALGRREEVSGEYNKKRVVMEGILERNHHHQQRQREH